MSLLERCERRAAEWLAGRSEDRLIKRFGGIQTCPWCRQRVQSKGEWGFACHSTEPQYDLLTCGVCGGTSVWLWGVGMHYIRPEAPPIPDMSAALAASREGAETKEG